MEDSVCAPGVHAQHTHQTMRTQCEDHHKAASRPSHQRTPPSPVRVSRGVSEELRPELDVGEPVGMNYAKQTKKV